MCGREFRIDLQSLSQESLGFLGFALTKLDYAQGRQHRRAIGGGGGEAKQALAQSLEFLRLADGCHQ